MLSPSGVACKPSGGGRHLTTNVSLHILPIPSESVKINTESSPVQRNASSNEITVSGGILPIYCMLSIAPADVTWAVTLSASPNPEFLKEIDIERVSGDTSNILCP